MRFSFVQDAPDDGVGFGVGDGLGDGDGAGLGDIVLGILILVKTPFSVKVNCVFLGTITFKFAQGEVPMTPAPASATAIVAQAPLGKVCVATQVLSAASPVSKGA